MISHKDSKTPGRTKGW